MQDIQDGKHEVREHVREVCEVMQDENKALIEESMRQLRELSDDQDGKIDEIRKYMQDQSYLMRVEVARKFQEQGKLNESVNERL